jgi:hypothetical protein
MDDITPILKGIATAATNPLAFVSYIVAVIACVLIRIRVGRNKNLLKRLKDLPASDRLAALEAEMGVIPLTKGLSPEQWIRSRINLYYFLGFLVFCGVFVILFAISSYAALYREKFSDRVVSDAIESEAVVSDQRLIRAVEEIDLGVGKDFVISRLGPPRHTAQWNKTTACADYEFSFAKLGIIYDLKKVVFVLVVSKRHDFHPDVIGRYGQKTRGCLGCFAFGDVTSPDEFFHEEERELHTPAIALQFGGNAKTDIYVEEYLIHPSWNRRVFLLNTPEAYEEKDNDEAFSKMASLIENWIPEDNSLKKVSPAERDIFEKSRKELRPNGFALLYEDEFWDGPTQISTSDPSIWQSRWPNTLVGTTASTLVGTVPSPIYFPGNCRELLLSHISP